MDKQKQIEEMAKYCCGACEMSWGCDEGDCSERGQDGYKACGLAKGVAERLYNANCRKIPEGAVVLTKGELAQIQSNFFDAGIKHGSKETAEKFAEMLKRRLYEYCEVGVSYDEFCEANVICDNIDEICKEITEGSNENC